MRLNRCGLPALNGFCEGYLQPAQRWFIVASLAAALAVGTLASARPDGVGTVGGQVVDPKERPVTGAHVTLQDSEGGHLQTAESNAQGRFWFPFLPEGQYSVRASSPGHVSEWIKNVWVAPGRETNVTLHLHAKKPALSPALPKT